ncbi:methyltransferase domain-containing protein [Candidatus Bathyarchaeota archaeon]|nr:methyltransferase domain-containing protein [Candidatus Bathyarchaeota archaeon]
MEKIRRTLDVYQDVAETYDRLNHSNRGIVDELEAFTSYVPGGIVLDVGCGHGRDSEYFTEHGYTVVGLDVSSALIRIARAKAPDAMFILSDMRQMALRNETCDGQWVCASFHHLPKECSETTLREFHRVLRRSGVLALSVKRGKGERDEPFNRYGGGPRFYAYYHEDELRDMLSGAGFKPVSSEVVEQTRFSRSWVNTLSRKASGNGLL